MSTNKSNALVNAITEISKYYSNVSSFSRALAMTDEGEVRKLATHVLDLRFKYPNGEVPASIAAISDRKAQLADLILHGNNGAPSSEDIYKTSTGTTAKEKVTQADILFITANAPPDGLIPGVVAKQMFVDKTDRVFNPETKVYDKVELDSIFEEGKFNASVSLIKDANLDVKGRGIDALTVFLNAIPTIEMSRCVPFMDVRVITLPRTKDDLGGNAYDSRRNVDLFTFLEGNLPGYNAANADPVRNAKIDLAAVDILKELPEEIQNISDEKMLEYTQRNASGMELFTSPQTLVNADEDVKGFVRDNPVQDKFRPLMSLISMNVTVTPSVNVICFETADIKIKLHDRSRLNEIASLIRPDLFGYTTMMIEYGWSHPDGSALSDNAYGRFLDSLRVKKHFRVHNCDYSFTKSGEVDINLKLVSKGAGAYFVTRVLNDLMGSSQAAEVARLVEQIQHIYGETPDLSGKSTFKKISPSLISDLIPNAQSAMDISSEGLAELQKLAGLLSATAEGKKLGTELNKLVDASTGKLTQMVKSAAGHISKKINHLRNTEDYALLHFTDIEKGHRANWPLAKAKGQLALAKASKDNAGGETQEEVSLRKFKVGYNRLGSSNKKKVLADKALKRSAKYVSISKIFEEFVVKPIAALKQFEDVQVFFYNMNDRCSWASHMNIGEVPINIDLFFKRFKEYKATTFNITINEFINFLNHFVFEDMSNPIYGLDGIYKVAYNKKEGGLKLSYPNKKKREELLATARKLAKGKNKQNLDAARKQSTDMKIQALTDDILRDAYGIEDSEQTAATGLEFKVPFLNVMTETLPMTSLKEGEHVNINNNKSVLRIHVSDQHASMYTGQQNFLRQAVDNLINQSLDQTLLDEEAKSHSNQDLKDRLLFLQTQLGQLMEGEGTASKNFGTYDAALVKELIKRTVPFANYGSNFSTINSANVSTMNDPNLSTVHMNRPGGIANHTESLTLPTTFNPTQVSLEMLGCPIVQYLQEIFLDFFTGTTIDNFYTVNSIKHDITPGSFKTTCDMYVTDGYAVFRTLENRIGDLAEKAAKDTE